MLLSKMESESESIIKFRLIDSMYCTEWFSQTVFYYDWKTTQSTHTWFRRDFEDDLFLVMSTFSNFIGE